MGTYKSDVDNPEFILNGRHEPVSVTFNVENHRIIGQKAGIPIDLLDV